MNNNLLPQAPLSGPRKKDLSIDTRPLMQQTNKNDAESLIETNQFDRIFRTNSDHLEEEKMPAMDSHARMEPPPPPQQHNPFQSPPKLRFNPIRYNVGKGANNDARRILFANPLANVSNEPSSIPNALQMRSISASVSSMAAATEIPTRRPPSEGESNPKRNQLLNRSLFGLIQGPVSIRASLKSFSLGWWKYIVHTRVTAFIHAFTTMLIVAWLKFIVDSYYDYQYLQSDVMDLSGHSNSPISAMKGANWQWIALCATHILLLVGLSFHLWIIPIHLNFPVNGGSSSGIGSGSNSLTNSAQMHPSSSHQSFQSYSTVDIPISHGKTRLIIMSQCVILVSGILAAYVFQITTATFPHIWITIGALLAIFAFSILAFHKRLTNIVDNDSIQSPILELTRPVSHNYQPLTTPTEATAEMHALNPLFNPSSEDETFTNEINGPIKAIEALELNSPGPTVPPELQLSQQSTTPNSSEHEMMGQIVGSSQAIDTVVPKKTDLTSKNHSFVCWLIFTLAVSFVMVCAYMLITIDIILPFVIQPMTSGAIGFVRLSLVVLSASFCENAVFCVARVGMRSSIVLLYNVQKWFAFECATISHNSSVSYSAASGRYRSFQNYNKMVAFAIPLYILCKINAIFLLYSLESIAYFAVGCLTYVPICALFNRGFQRLDRVLIGYLVGDTGRQTLQTSVHRRHSIQLGVQCSYISDISQSIALLICPVIFLIFRVNYRLGADVTESAPQWSAWHYLLMVTIHFTIQFLLDVTPLLVLANSNARINSFIRGQDILTSQPSNDNQSENNIVYTQWLEFTLQLKKEYVNVMNGWSTTDKRLRYYMWSTVVCFCGLYTFLVFFPMQQFCVVEYNKHNQLPLWTYVRCH